MVPALRGRPAARPPLRDAAVHGIPASWTRSSTGVLAATARRAGVLPERLERALAAQVTLPDLRDEVARAWTTSAAGRKGDTPARKRAGDLLLVTRGRLHDFGDNIQSPVELRKPSRPGFGNAGFLTVGPSRQCVMPWPRPAGAGDLGGRRWPFLDAMPVLADHRGADKAQAAASYVPVKKPARDQPRAGPIDAARRGLQCAAAVGALPG